MWDFNGVSTSGSRRYGPPYYESSKKYLPKYAVEKGALSLDL